MHPVQCEVHGGSPRARPNVKRKSVKIRVSLFRGVESLLKDNTIET